MKKKIIVTVSVLLAVVLILGGVFTYLRLKRDPAKVYPVQDISVSGSEMGGINSLYGTVRTDRIQTVYPSDTQTITETLVSLGQAVKKGDALFRYDTSMSALQLQRKNLEIQKLQRELLHTKEEYNALVGYRAYTLSMQESGLLTMSSVLLPGGISCFTDAPTEAPTAPTEAPTAPTEAPTAPTAAPTEPTEEPGVLPADGIVVSYALVGGDGSAEAPYLCVYADGNPFDNDFLARLLEDRSEATVVLVQCEENAAAGIVLSALKLELLAVEDGYTVTLCDASDYVGDTLENYGKEPDPIDPSDPIGGGMSYAELQKLKQEKAQAIRDLDLQIRMEQVEYARMQKELGDGVIYAQMDGEVTLLNDQQTAAMNGEPLLKLSDGGGYYIEGTISELALETVQPGQGVSIQSWYSGTVMDGTVASVSTYPSTSYGWSNGNPNVTYYSFEVFVDGEANLLEGESVEMSLAAQEGTDDALYLDKTFVLLENGRYYVYVRAENELLEKREISVGKTLWDSYLEIRGVLRRTDAIAFPYGKTVTEGAKTELSSVEELYNY